MWIALTSERAVQELLQQFDGFHDGCLREVSLATETYVDERGAMACPGHLDTSALLYFQSQNRSLSAIEFRCDGVTAFRLRPTAEGCDSIVSSGTIDLQAESCRIAVRFVGGPLSGPPNTGVWLPARSPDDPDLEVVARRIEWRAIDNAFGDRPRYRPSHAGRRHDAYVALSSRERPNE